MFIEIYVFSELNKNIVLILRLSSITGSIKKEKLIT